MSIRLAFTAPPWHSSNKLDSALGLIAVLARLYSLYGIARDSSIFYVGEACNGLSKSYFIVKIRYLLPLTKSTRKGSYAQYYPSRVFLPSVASTAF